MKIHLFAFAVVTATTVLPLAACQTSTMADNSDRPAERQIYVSTQGIDQRTVTVPENRTTVDNDRPYALRGDDAARQNAASAATTGEWAAAHATNRQ